MKIPLIKPYINQEIKNRVLDVLDSGYIPKDLLQENLKVNLKNL